MVIKVCRNFVSIISIQTWIYNKKNIISFFSASKFSFIYLVTTTDLTNDQNASYIKIKTKDNC